MGLIAETASGHPAAEVTRAELEGAWAEEAVDYRVNGVNFVKALKAWRLLARYVRKCGEKVFLLGTRAPLAP